MASLSAADARIRAASISVERYEIEMDLTLGDRVFGSTTRIEFDSNDGAATFVDVQPDTHNPGALISARLNGEPVESATVSNGRLEVHPTAGRNVVEIDATMAYSHDGEGLHRFVDPLDQRAYVYLMSFLDAAPRAVSPVSTSPTSRRPSG